MVDVAGRLRSLRSTDPAPDLDELGGPGLFGSQLATLEPELLVRAAESVWSSWSTLADGQRFVRLLAHRLRDIDGDMAFAELSSGLVDAALTGAAADVDTVLDALLAALTPDAVTGRPLRAGRAIHAAADIATAAEGPSRHKVLAQLSGLTDIPADVAAAFARACGRLLDHADEAWLRDLVEQRLLIHRRGAPQAAVELGYCRLRDAFNAADEAAALAALQEAAAMFEQAAAADEQRADADAMAAAARCVLAFAAGDVATVAAERQRLERRRTELVMFSATPSSRFEAAAGAWLLLAGDLLALEQHLAYDKILGLEKPVRAIARAHEGVRLQVLDDERFGLRTVIRPRIIETLQARSFLRQGIQELAGDRGESGLSVSAQALTATIGAPPKASAPRRRQTLRLVPA